MDHQSDLSVSWKRDEKDCYLYNSASNQSKLWPVLPQKKSSQAGDDFTNSLPFNRLSSHTDLAVCV